MLRKAKNFLYFFVAGYFRFFAAIQLQWWHPRIAVITGSNGKTTALHIAEAELGEAARYSHHANSSFGIPFDILGMKRVTYSVFEWFTLALFAPVRAFKKPFPEKIYIVEADCDRPNEGHFLSSLLRPEVTIWLSSARTHSQNFDKLVGEQFPSVDEAIAYEFGYFLQHTSQLVIINADNPLITAQMPRTQAQTANIHLSELTRHDVSANGTTFAFGEKMYTLPYLMPKENFYAIRAVEILAGHFGLPYRDLTAFKIPPGRTSIFKGIKNTTIIDSSYNANVASVAVALNLVKKIMAPDTWLILGDLLEQGTQEREEHEKVARLVAAETFRRVLLVGPRLGKYALPLLPSAIQFDKPREALDYIRQNLIGGEMLVFKGARFLEGIIEHLLADPKDSSKLCRREPVWQKRRAQWGL